MTNNERDNPLHYPRQAHALLKAMETPYNIDRSIPVDSTTTITTIPQSWRLNAVDYGIVLQTYAECNGGTAAAEEATEIVKRHDNKLSKLMSRMLTLAIVTVRKDNVQLQDIIKPVEPDTRAFNIAMHCWAKSGDSAAGMKAEQLFKFMNHWR